MRSDQRIGIIVVTHQSARHIAPLWRSLAATIDPQRTFIYVFDNASTDETVAILERENAVLRLPLQLMCSESNLGFARAFNDAYDHLQAQASHDVAIRLDPDTVLQAGWWQPLVEALEDSGVGCAVPLLLMPDGKINSRGNALHFLGLGYVQGLGEDVATARLDEPFFFGSGAALALDVEALTAMKRSLGSNRILWDELFIYAEDTDLGWRLRLAGYEPKLCAESRVVHDYRFPIAKTIAVESRLFWLDRNRLLLLIANFKAATLLVLLPWIIASELALACGVWKLYPHRFALWKAVWKEVCSPAFRSRRRNLQAGRKKKDRDILRAMTGSIRHGALNFSLMDRLLDLFLRGSHCFLCAIVRW